MAATYAINTELNGIEITFDSKPGEQIRAALKENGFRWHRVRGLWYAKNSAARLELAQRLADAATVTRSEAEAKEAATGSLPAGRIAHQGGERKHAHYKEGRQTTMTLKLEKMGCDFYTDDQRAASDCTNFRLRVHDIRTKDGKIVVGDFLRGCRYDFSKATPRKTSDWQLYTDLSYTDTDGMTWSYTPDGKGGRLRNYDKCTDSPYYGVDYTLDNILRVVNEMSVDHYDAVELVQVHP